MIKRPSYLLLIALLTACSGGGGSGTKALDKTGTVTDLTTLQETVIDQIAFELEDDTFSTLSLEVHLIDAQTDETILCAGTTEGLNKVNAEVLIHGNLAINFARTITDDAYEGELFQIALIENDEDPCVKNSSDTLIDKTSVFNFNTMISTPLTGNAGKFYIRLREESASPFSVPKTITNLIPLDTFQVDQLEIDSEAELTDLNDGIGPIVRIIDAATDELVGYSDDTDGLEPMDYQGVVFSKLLADIINPDGDFISYEETADTVVKVRLYDEDNYCFFVFTASDCSGDGEDDFLGESEEMAVSELPGRNIQLFANDDSLVGSITFTEVGD